MKNGFHSLASAALLLPLVAAPVALGADVESLPIGGLAAWGDNLYGQATVPAGIGDVRAIAAGRDHSLALGADGIVYAWGRNKEGQCVVREGLSGVCALAAGEFHSMALLETGEVVCWGSNKSE